MKKVILSIAFVVYFVFSCGVVVNAHYCMNKLSATEYFKPPKTSCARCGMNNNKKHSCCHDEVKIVKLPQAQHKTTFDFSILVPKVLPVKPSPFLLSPFYNISEFVQPADYSPPRAVPDDIYIENRVLRI